jgi:hypothetical protein
MPLALVADSLKVLNSDLWSFGSYLLATDVDELDALEHALAQWRWRCKDRPAFAEARSKAKCQFGTSRAHQNSSETNVRSWCDGARL